MGNNSLNGDTLFSRLKGWKGEFSHGNLWTRELGRFTGETYAYSRLSWDDVDINRKNFRSISPRDRLYGLGAYGQDTMLNISSLRESNGRTSSGWGNFWANGGVASGAASVSQISTLDMRPSVFWDARRFDYGTYGSAGAFTSQNSSHFYSVWRFLDGSDVVIDVAGGGRGAGVVLNNDIGWDDQLFVINGQGKGNTPNGSPLSKVVLSTGYTDFSVSRPLLMSLVGGLPRPGGDIVSKDEPGDAWWRAGDFDYYLNYYPKYDGTSKKLLAKDDGYDWGGLTARTQIDGTQPVAQQAAEAASFATGYSKVGEVACI